MYFIRLKKDKPTSFTIKDNKPIPCNILKNRLYTPQYIALNYGITPILKSHEILECQCGSTQFKDNHNKAICSKCDKVTVLPMFYKSCDAKHETIYSCNCFNVKTQFTESMQGERDGYPTTPCCNMI